MTGPQDAPEKPVFPFKEAVLQGSGPVFYSILSKRKGGLFLDHVSLGELQNKFAQNPRIQPITA